MNCQNRAALFITLLTLAVSCGRSSEKKDPLLDEAARYHNEATRIQALVEPKIEQIDSLKTRLSARSTPVAQATVATLDSLKKAFSDWEENVVEVPGMPHHHTGGADHRRHKHQAADAALKDLPADQMRDLQREMLSTIKRIQSRLDAVMQSTQ